MFKPKVEAINTVNDWSNVKITNKVSSKYLSKTDSLSKDTNIMIRRWSMENIAQSLHIAKNNNSDYKLLIDKNTSSIIRDIKNDVFILYSYLSISSTVYNFKIPNSMCFVYDDMLPIYNKYMYENRLLELTNCVNCNTLRPISTFDNYIKDISTIALSEDFIGDKLDKYIMHIYNSLGFSKILTSMSHGDTLPNFYVLKEILGDWLGKDTKYITDNKLKKLLTCVFHLMSMKIPASYLLIDLEVRDWTYNSENNYVTH